MKGLLLAVLICGSVVDNNENAAHSRDAAIERYRRQLKSGDAKKRARAAVELGTLGATEAIQDLSVLLRDTSVEAKYAALRALGDIGTEAVVPEVRPFLESPDPNAKILAARALLAAGDRNSTQRLIELLSRGSPYVQQNLAIALGLSRVEEAVPCLEKLVASPDETTRYWSISALGLIGKQSSGPVVARFMEDDDPYVRAAAVNAIGQIDPKRYREVLSRALGSSELREREGALHGLARIRDPEARRVAMSLAKYELLNYYTGPKACEVLDRTYLSARLLRRQPIGKVIETLSDQTGLRFEVAGVPKDQLAVLYRRSDLLGPAPSAMTVLHSLGQLWGDGPEGAVTFIVERDVVRVVAAEAAVDFWTRWSERESE